MTTSLDTRIPRTLVTLVALAVALVGAAPALAGGRPAASYYTKQQLQAMSERGAAKAAHDMSLPVNRPAASYYTKQQLRAMSQSWAARAAVSSPTPEGKALLARIAVENAGRPAASYYTKAQLETMSQSWAAKAAASLRQSTGSSSGGFAWGEFGIGASGMLGLVLMLGGGIVALRYRRRSTGLAVHRIA